MQLSTATCIGTAIASLLLPAALGAQPTPEQTAWIKANAVPLKTIEAGHGFEDLQPMKAMVGEARIVGLGEGTHGTREYFQAKHRLLEFLVEEMGFSIFSIEANMPESYELNSYVLGGEGDVNALIGGMYFWTWNTEEVRDMVEWMRRFNAEQKAKGDAKRVQFTGFDMQTGAVALRQAREFLEKHDPELVEKRRGDLDMLASFNPHAGVQQGFGCATGKFPVEAARGKRIRFSGWARTEALKDGWAGLWWRVDGPTPKFDNMSDRGLRGTTDWTELSIEMDVPEDGKAIYFGLVMPGTGKGWFDELKVEIDGKPWTSADFGLDFEEPAPKGIVSANPAGGRASAGYRMTMDKTVKHSGQQSALLESIGEREGMPAEEKAKRATSAVGLLLESMIAARDKYVAATDAKSADWALQNMRVVSQWVGMATDPERGSAHRDECMAANVKWIMDQNPGAKMVIWAHNWHVRNEAPWMGSHLRRIYGKDYINLAFCSSGGKYYAAGNNGMGTFDLAKPDAESFEAMLETAESPIVLVDLRQGKPGDAGSGWLTEERPFGGVIGAMQMPEHYHSTQMQGGFDLLLYIRETTAARQLKKVAR